MFIDVSKNNGKDYLRLVNSIRVANKDGYKIPQKKVVLNIGPLARFDDGQPNYLERLRKSFRAGTPMIPSLGQYCTDESPREKYTFTFEEGNPDCAGNPKIFSHLFLERILEELGLQNFFSSYKGFTKIEFDVYGFAKLLLIGRLLNPASKMATVCQNDDYYDAILADGFNPDNVYDTLDFIAENKDKIIRRINTNLVKKGRRCPEIIYYDVTNFYFEIEEPDDDEYDEDGEVCEIGFRKMGVSKENRKQPIVQMGLFMDDKGIPIAVESFPGNTLDHLTLRGALKNIDGIDFSRFILIGGRGVCMYLNLLHLVDGGNGYIVAKSLLKSKADEREWAYSEDGYIHDDDDFKYKSRVVKRKVKDENKKVRTISELVVVYWSRKFEKRQMAENRSFLEFIEKLLEHPANFRVTATQAKSIRQYLRKEVVNDKTGEIINSSELKAMLDMDKINRFKEGMGYYQIVTSELQMLPKEVIDKYHGLSRIEDQFRAMKGDLHTRPMFVRNKEHIKAHLLICTIALIMMRIIQNRIVDSGVLPSAKDKGANWTAGLSAERVQKALNKWQVERMPDDYYRFLNTDDIDLNAILEAFGIKIPFKMFKRGELKSIKTGTKIFM